MTLEEMNEEAKEGPPKRVPFCLPCIRSERELPDMGLGQNEATLARHVFLGEDPATGRVVYMTVTEDGRRVPLEDW